MSSNSASAPRIAGYAQETTPLRGRAPASVQKSLTGVAFQRLLHYVMPPLGLLSFGVVALTSLEGWPIGTSVYVVTQMLTTVGYGDFTVTTMWAKLFMAFYAITVLALLAYYYNLYINVLVTWQSDCLRKYLRRSELFLNPQLRTDAKAAEHYHETNQMIAAVVSFGLFVAVGTVWFRLTEGCACDVRNNVLHHTEVPSPNCKDETYDMCVATGGHVKTGVDALYMSVITLTTIGFGDYHPRTWYGHLFACVWMLVGVATTSACFATTSSWFFGASKMTHFEAAEAVCTIDSMTFKRIDRDHSGTLSRGEFLSFVLVKYGLVEDDLVEDINRAYDVLDREGKNNVSIERIKSVQRGALST